MTTRIQKLSISAGIFALLAAASVPAFADDDAYCGNIPRAEWKSISEASAAVTAKGYEIREIEADDGCYEVEARKETGERVELYLNPRTLEIVKTERD